MMRIDINPFFQHLGRIYKKKKITKPRTHLQMRLSSSKYGRILITHNLSYIASKFVS